MVRKKRPLRIGNRVWKPVKLTTVAGVAKASPSSCHIKRSHLLAWYSGDGGAYVVQFKDDSPFELGKEFHVPKGSAHAAGPVRSNEPGYGASYPYRVFPGGEDPDVVVDEGA